MPNDPANVRGPMPVSHPYAPQWGMGGGPTGVRMTPFAAPQYTWGMQPQRMQLNARQGADITPTPIPGINPRGNVRQDDINQAWQALYGNTGFGAPSVNSPPSTWNLANGSPFGWGYSPAGRFPSGPGGQGMNWYNGPTYPGAGGSGFGGNPVPGFMGAPGSIWYDHPSELS